MGKPSIVGAGDLDVNESARLFAWRRDRAGGDWCRSTADGRVKLAKVPSKRARFCRCCTHAASGASDIYQRFERLLGWRTSSAG